MAALLAEAVMLTGLPEATIWYHWTIFYGAPLEKIVMPTNQKQLKIWKPTFVMPLSKYDRVRSKKCTKISTIKWGAVRPAAAAIWRNYFPFPTETIVLHNKKKIKLIKFQIVFILLR